MAIARRTISYAGPGGPFEGIACWDDAIAGARPGILVSPMWRGRSAFEEGKAEALATLGYVGFSIDPYGAGFTPAGEGEARALMDALGADRRHLQARMAAALAALRAIETVDTARVGAIGFCFGGKCVLDLARAGSDVAGVVSFHGVYDPPPHGSELITAKVLVLHGWDDPLCPPAATTALAEELTAAGADWQILALGHTGHGFMNPEARFPERGVLYNPAAERRAWLSMRNFFGELWG